MNRDYDFTGIEQAVRYSKLEHMSPGGISEWSKEAEYMVLLFETNRARKGWGISEGVYVDVRCDVPYYIVTQYDGQIAATTWYLDKDELTFDQVREYIARNSRVTQRIMEQDIIRALISWLDSSKEGFVTLKAYQNY